jgi:hypothetical protein
MNYLGDFAAGGTVYVPFHTFSSDDPSASITLTGLAVTDIEIYKNGSTTQRASDAGYTLLDTDGIDFDGVTGLHGFSIDLSDNTDSGFYAAGNDYWIAVSSVTVDGATINFWAGTFSIQNRYMRGTDSAATAAALGTPNGASISADIAQVRTDVGTVDTVVDGIQTDLSNGTDGLGAIKTAVDGVSASASPQLLVTTTIATLATQVSFTLTAGSADDDAYNDCLVIVQDQSTATQKCVGTISDYAGSTKTITLNADPAIFTMATGDTISVIAPPAGDLGAGIAGALIAIGLLPTAAENRAEMDSNSTQLAKFGTPATSVSADIAAAKTVVDGIQTDLSNGTDGLGAIKTAVDGVSAGSGPTVEEIRAEIDTNSTKLIAILADTSEIGTAGAGFTNIPWNPSWDAEVQSEVADAMTAYNVVATTDLPTNFADMAIESSTGIVSVNVKETNDSTVYGNGTSGNKWRGAP